MKLHNNLQNAMSKSEKVRPKIGGFPYLAECLREEGFIKNTWYLPSGDSFYFSKEDSLVIPGKSLFKNITVYPSYSEEELIRALRTDQAGKTTFPEFLMNTWKSGVVKYEVNFIDRYVVYYGANGEEYKEVYPAVEIN
ncbi:DUF1398 family protein [Lactococcus petauri]|uniref:DUF1398 family protein n=1 Tax=Lactococcus petauri TaxID=1940789 RepID=UPI00326453E8